MKLRREEKSLRKLKQALKFINESIKILEDLCRETKSTVPAKKPRQKKNP